jgi:hypothetical protein
LIFNDSVETPVEYVASEKFIRKMLYFESLDYETLKLIYKFTPQIESCLQINAYNAVRSGNHKLAHQLIKSMLHDPNVGFD